MRVFLILFFILVIGCTGSLTEDQRKRIRESMKEGEIKKVSEAEIVDAAFSLGRKLIQQIPSDSLPDQTLMTSLANQHQTEVIVLNSTTTGLRDKEKQILEAYMAGGSDDNVQKVGSDSLFYSKPYLIKNPDGSSSFHYAIGIRITRKQLVMSINK